MHELRVFYRPDNYPHWVAWKEFTPGRFTVIGEPGAISSGGVPTARAGFSPRQSLGKPPDACDEESTNRRLRRGYQFQVKFKGSGHCIIDQFRIHAQKLIERSRAAQP
jgi:hypothetical protein